MFPKQIMTEVKWGFSGGRYESRKVFIKEVTKYNKGLSTHWRPKETVLESPKVSIQYSYWNNDRNNVEEEEFNLIADNASGFTAGELLYKIHNQVVDTLEEEQFRFFEGLTLWKNKKSIRSTTPLYFINQISL